MIKLIIVLIIIILFNVYLSNATQQQSESSRSSIIQGERQQSLHNIHYNRILPDILNQFNLNHNNIVSLYNQCSLFDREDVTQLDQCQQQSNQIHPLTPCPYCRLRTKSNMLLAFDYYYSSHVHAQRTALDVLKGVLSRKIANPNSRAVILLAGDHGVGKTTSSRIFSKVLFKTQKTEFDGDGILLVQSEFFRKVTRDKEAAIRNARNHLMDTVLNQLKECPESIIIIDEIQKIHPLVLSVLEPFFEGLPVNGTITNAATYFLTSDFEKEGVTRDKNLDEIIQLITSYSKAIYKDFKLMSLITDIAPFKPLTKIEIEKQVEESLRWNYCKRLRQFGLTDIIVNDMTSYKRVLHDKMMDLHTNENFRGIDKVISRVLDNIEVHLVTHTDHYSSHDKYDPNTINPSSSSSSIMNHNNDNNNIFINSYGFVKGIRSSLSNILKSHWKQNSCIVIIDIDNNNNKLITNTDRVGDEQQHQQESSHQPSQRQQSTVDFPEFKYRYIELTEWCESSSSWNPFSNRKVSNITWSIK